MNDASSKILILALCLSVCTSLFCAEDCVIRVNVPASFGFTEDGEVKHHHPLLWYPGREAYLLGRGKEDNLVVFLRDKSRPDFLDVWVVRSERSFLSSYADNLHARILPDGRIVYFVDSGDLPWKTTTHKEYAGEIVPSYAANAPDGSQKRIKVARSEDKCVITLTADASCPLNGEEDLETTPSTEYAVSFLPAGSVGKITELKFTPVTAAKDGGQNE